MIRVGGVYLTRFKEKSMICEVLGIFFFVNTKVFHFPKDFAIRENKTLRKAIFFHS